MGRRGGQCPIQNWCVCEWAFANYIEAAGGCDKIQDIVCDSINSEAVDAYISRKDEAKYANALECIVNRCNVDLTTYRNTNFIIDNDTIVSTSITVEGLNGTTHYA